MASDILKSVSSGKKNEESAVGEGIVGADFREVYRF
jgi:hypothetical protein